MDGTRSKSRTTHALRRRAASLVLAAGALLAAAPAQADPATDFAQGSAPFEAAAQIARDYWQINPCAGQVAVVWMGLAEATNATSSWTNPVGQYDAPEQNGSCQIAFNKALAWDWTRFCSILVHEYGHLAGRSHAEDAADVMYAYYEAPVAQCVAAAPAQPVSAPAVAATPPAPDTAVTASAGEPSTTRAAQPRAITSNRAEKRGRLVLVRKHAKAKRHARKHQRAKHRRQRAKQHRRHRAHRAGRLVRVR